MTGSSNNGAPNDAPKNNHSTAKDEMAELNRLVFDSDLTEFSDVQ